MAETKEVTPELIISANPHIRHPDTVPRIMSDVLIALLPAFVAAIYVSGLRAFTVTLVCVIGAVAGEAIVQYLRGVTITIDDGSAAVMGVLLAFCCPVTIPFWMAFLGSFLAIIVAKQAFGGLGNNPFNPAHIGRAFLLASWPVALTTWVAVSKLATRLPYTNGGAIRYYDLWWNPFWDVNEINATLKGAGLDAVTEATPLATLSSKIASGSGAGLVYARETFWDAFVGTVGGCLGETSALALLLGAAFLFYRGHISWRIPVPMIGTVFFLTWFWIGDVTIALFHLVIGGLMLGAFFMATDMVTTPVTKPGRIIFGIGCGIIVFLIRQFGAYPEGVCYSILLMNAATPVIDHYTRPKVFGAVK